MSGSLDRRRFLARSGKALSASLLGGSLGGLALGACSRADPERYHDADIALLAAQREAERLQSGRGPFGPQRYRGYRGLAELPWFELDSAGVLRLVDEQVPKAIEFHYHLGMSVLFEPKLDLKARTDSVRHLLDCDATDPGCDLDLDVYINANFTDEALDDLECTTIAQGLWGNDAIRSQTIPNLLAERRDGSSARRTRRDPADPLRLPLRRQSAAALAGGERLLFGTDWPFYHLAATLAKVLIVTDDPERYEIRHTILRGNAEQLLA